MGDGLRVVRDVVALAGGLGGALHEVAIPEPRPVLLAAFLAMVGLPVWGVCDRALGEGPQGKAETTPKAPTPRVGCCGQGAVVWPLWCPWHGEPSS